MATRQEGYLFVDHRASPGLSTEQAERMGVDPKLVREGGVFEAATKRCCHCGRVVIINPCRQRERAICFTCHEYVCDECAIVMREPGYQHHSFDRVVELLQSGKWDVGTGSTPSKINLIPAIGDIKNG